MLRVLTCLLILALPTALHAQAPTIDPPFPMGAQRGTTVELTLTGSNLHDPLNVMTSFPGKVTIPTVHNNGKLPGKLVVRLEVPPSTPLGWHSFRLVTKRGVTAARLFCVDDLPQVIKTGAPNTWELAQTVPVPSVVCGTIEKDKADYYQFQARAGERLSFEVLGRRLGSTLDPQLFLYHGKTRKQLAYSDDARGQDRDPRFGHVFAEAGTYVLEVRDARQQGGKDWHYRLRLGDFPLTTTTFPLAVQRGIVTPVTFVGPPLEPMPVVRVAAPAEAMSVALSLWTTSPPLFPQRLYGLPSWPLSVPLSDVSEAVEIEPNDSPTTAPLLPVPSGMSGRIQKPGDKDFFRFKGKKGARYLVEVQTVELHSPAVVQMTLRDAAGKQLGLTTPDAQEMKIDFTAPAEGEYTLLVEHAFYQGSSEDAYRFTIRPFAPGFTLATSTDHVNVPPGGAAAIAVQVTRREYDGPIDVQVNGPPGVQGKVTVPAKQNSAQLMVQVSAKVPQGAYALSIQGKATINGQTVQGMVETTPAWKTTLNQLPQPPQHLRRDFVLGVTEKPKFGWPFR